MSAGKRYVMTVPTVTEMNTILTEPTGTQCFVEDESKLYVWNGSLWVLIGGSSTANIRIYVDDAARTADVWVRQGDIGFAIIEQTTLIFDGAGWIAIAP